MLDVSGGGATISSQGNIASGQIATIGGGLLNEAVGWISTIGGGNGNKITGYYSVIAGGGTADSNYGNSISGESSFIGGGFSNTISGDKSVIGGGATSTVSGMESFIGGGTGIAPIYFLAKVLHNNGLTPTVLMGSRDKEGLLRIDDFKQFGEIFYTTEDGSAGEKGFVTHHSILKNAAAEYDMIYSCGPEPMMKAVGQLALKNNIDCEVSLENLMACGVGACLCCVVETNSGNICTCTEGPIFKVKDLKW